MRYGLTERKHALWSTKIYNYVPIIFVIITCNATKMGVK